METISLTSKGQVTLPVEFRRALNIKDGDKLLVTYNPTSRSLVLRKPLTIDELSSKVAKYIKKNPKPVLNVDEYYQTNRVLDHE